MHIQIYTMTHKKFSVPPDPMYVPLQVGSAVHEPLGYLRDDSGENISAQNCYYAELTGMYWVWKNVFDADYVGVCHYRRYLLNELGFVYTKKELEQLLQHYDILTSMKLKLNFSYEYGFTVNHTKEDLDAADTVIHELYPDFYPLYRKRIQENHTYFGNLMICSKKLYDEYCSFLFPIFANMHKLLQLDSYDEYHKRLYGFLSEFLLMVWTEYRRLKVRECKVGMIGAKNETGEVVEQMLSLFAEKKVEDAKTYFLSCYQKRPDILMEASDIDGHLHLCLEAVSVFEYESLHGMEKIPITEGKETLFGYLEQLNEAVLALTGNTYGAAETERMKDERYSEYAIAVSVKLYAGQEQKAVCALIDTLCQRKIPLL